MADAFLCCRCRHLNRPCHLSCRAEWRGFHVFCTSPLAPHGAIKYNSAVPSQREHGSLTYRRAPSRRTGRHIGRVTLARWPPTDGERQNTAARTGVRQRQNVRNQRKVASGQRPLILMGRNTMVRRVGIHAAYFWILVPSKALSGACPETRISRVRRSNFASVRHAPCEQRRHKRMNDQ